MILLFLDGHAVGIETPTVKEQAYEYVMAKGYDKEQWNCVDELVWRESRWIPTANNPNSSAYGLGQVLNSEDEGDSVTTQMGLMLDYIDHRYDTPCKALSFHNKHHWY